MADGDRPRGPGAPPVSGPAAVVVGLDTITGLQTARILHARGVPVVGLTNDRGHWACRTRACERVVEADLLGDGFVDALVRLGPELGDRAALFPCTDLAVLAISRHRDRLAPWFSIALPDHDVVELLMDKIGFLHHAEAHGLPVPRTVVVGDRAAAAEAAATLSFPAVLKPPVKTRTWQAHTQRKGFPVADGRELLEVYDRVGTWSDTLIVQEWITGGADSLFSCNAYLDRSSRPLATFIARKLRQWPPDTGTSSLGEEVRDDEVLSTSLRLFEQVDYQGLGYVEMKRDTRTGRALLIECNVGRPTGRSAIAEGGGVELLYTAYCDMVGLRLPAAREQRYTGVKWIDDRRDVQSALASWRRGELTLGSWWRSVRGRKVHAVVSLSDPAPFLHDLFRSTRRGVRMLRRRLRPGPHGPAVPQADPLPQVAVEVPVPLSGSGG